MKIYVTNRFKNASPETVEPLCRAVRDAGHDDFSFIRDVEKFEKMFDDPKELWNRSRKELIGCDALLIDVSDAPSGGRVIEAGIAFGLKMPVFTCVKKGTPYKEAFDGVSTELIEYEDFGDITKALNDIRQ